MADFNERQIKDIEDKLTFYAEMYNSETNAERKGNYRGFCQGIAFMLNKFDYVIEWNDETAKVVKFNSKKQA